MPLAELTQRALRYDLHRLQVACSQNGNMRDAALLIWTLTERSDALSRIRFGYGVDRERRIGIMTISWNGEKAPTPPGSSYG